MLAQERQLLASFPNSAISDTTKVSLELAVEEIFSLWKSANAINNGLFQHAREPVVKQLPADHHTVSETEIHMLK